MKAAKSQHVAAVIFELGFFDDAANRAYYAMFNAITLLNALHGHDQGSGHKEVLTAFNREFVLNGGFPTTFGKMLSDLYSLRQKADYDHLQNVGPEGSQRCARNTDQFLNEVKEHVDALSPGLLLSRAAVLEQHALQTKDLGKKGSMDKPQGLSLEE
jgi:uncharacterized protein (UPF0332 family)